MSCSCVFKDHERRRPLFGGAFGSFVFVQNSRSRRPRPKDDDHDRKKV